MTRTLVDLDQSATVLEAAERIAKAPAEEDVVVVATAGSPFLRNAIFIDVARRTAADRRFALVTPDQRARSLAASVHVAAYASVAALERHELDATERLDRARAAVLARPSRRGPRAPAITRRGLGIAASLLAAAALLVVVLMPAATVLVASSSVAIGPLDLEIRAGPGMDVASTPLSGTVTAKATGTTTGHREELTKATGSVRLSNKRTEDIRIVRGTLFSTSDGIRFLSTEERTLPRSVVFFPLNLTVGTVDVPIEAQTVGPPGNVDTGRITVGPRPNDYEVTNPSPTSGGDIKRIPIVQQADYDAAAGEIAQRKLQEAAEIQLGRWRADPEEGRTVVPRVTVKLTSVTPASAVVGREPGPTFDLEVTGVATAYAVPDDEPTRTALGRLRALLPPDHELRDEDADVQWQLADDPSGEIVVWRVRASGTAVANVNSGVIQRALAGRAPDEAAAVLDRFGIRLVGIGVAPWWWPRLPLLDARIEVQERPATAP